MRTNASWAAAIVGLLLAALGAIIGSGGAWLVALGGSPYYLAAGTVMLVAGAALAAGLPWGAWLYAALALATVPWAFAEAGLDGWALMPRLVGPLLLLALVLLVLPTLSPPPCSWRRAWTSILVLSAATAATFAAISRPEHRVGTLPQAIGVMADTSPNQAGRDWPAYGGSDAARRWSPLAQIDANNVAQLQKAWEVHVGGLASDPFYRGLYGTENTPIKVGELLYSCTAKNVVVALDARSGSEHWRFDPHVPDRWIPYTSACRGVAYHRDDRVRPGSPCAARIIWGTLDSRLIAVDGISGRPCVGFGAGGQVDTKAGMGRVEPGMASITAPPTIVRGVIVVGHQILDGQTRDAPSGVIQGFDALTGRLRWAWDLSHPAWRGAPPAGRTWSRGTPNMWTAASADERLGLVFLPLGSAAVDYWSGSRRAEEDAFATSLVALDAATGRPRWRFQAVRHDVWDYDLSAQATLVDAKGRPALLLATKTGDFYILDRATGRPLTPVGELRVAQTGAEPARRTPTQPVSLWHRLFPDRLTEADMWGISPLDQLYCRIRFRQARYAGPYTPPEVARDTVQYPSNNGGVDWGGVAVDPVHRVAIVNYTDVANLTRLVPRAEADRMGLRPRFATNGPPAPSHATDPQWGAPFAIKINAGWRNKVTRLLCKRPPYGGIRAIDLATGRTIWDRPLGEARRNGPFDIASRLPWTIGTPNNGGAVVTAGGLVFIAAATDDRFRAIDLRTGRVLWSVPLPAGGQATPMVFEAGGREFVAIFAGGHHQMGTTAGDSVVAYALPKGR